MNVGYFSVPVIDGNEFVNMELLASQELVREGKFVRWVRFKNSLEILMDGRKRTAVVRMK
jgi:hypothetical protein